MVGRRLGATVEAAFLRGLESFDVQAPQPDEWPAIASYVEEYADWPLGGTDASVLTLAERLDTDVVVTLDRRHLGAVRPRHRDALRLLPAADAMHPDAVEIRVLGCLIEKRQTTPDQYPLSLNALRLACNQSTNRDPVVDYDEATIRDAITRLGHRSWVRLASGAGDRVAQVRARCCDDELTLSSSRARDSSPVLMLPRPADAPAS